MKNKDKLEIKDLIKIEKNSDIAVGDLVVIAEDSEDKTKYFKPKLTEVAITSIDDSGDLWAYADRNLLSDFWDTYDTLCLGSPECSDCDITFYKKK